MSSVIYVMSTFVCSSYVVFVFTMLIYMSLQYSETSGPNILNLCTSSNFPGPLKCSKLQCKVRDTPTDLYEGPKCFGPLRCSTRDCVYLAYCTCGKWYVGVTNQSCCDRIAHHLAPSSTSQLRRHLNMHVSSNEMHQFSFRLIGYGKGYIRRFLLERNLYHDGPLPIEHSLNDIRGFRNPWQVYTRPDYADPWR